MVPSEIDLPQVRVELMGSCSSAQEKREEEEARLKSASARKICAMLSRRSRRRSSNGSPLRRSCGMGSSPLRRSCGVGSSPYMRSCGMGSSSAIALLGVETGGAVQRRALIPSPRLIYLLFERREEILIIETSNGQVIKWSELLRTLQYQFKGTG